METVSVELVGLFCFILMSRVALIFHVSSISTLGITHLELNYRLELGGIVCLLWLITHLLSVEVFAVVIIFSLWL